MEVEGRDTPIWDCILSTVAFPYPLVPGMEFFTEKLIK